MRKSLQNGAMRLLGIFVITGMGILHADAKFDLEAAVMPGATFGAVVDDALKPITLDEAVAQADALADSPIAITATASTVCQKKGCFFIATQGPTAVRISFQDYGFFVPRALSGHKVRLDGHLKRVSRSVEQAAHFKEDAGSASEAASLSGLDSGPVFEFVATGVVVLEES